ncbi:MAG TPA: ABC transporter substrate-binding protein [Thermomicrobiales bacterium]|nr:ABC transporter substrate-binding protein [Thermomicrobiales bacterium]
MRRIHLLIAMLLVLAAMPMGIGRSVTLASGELTSCDPVTAAATPAATGEAAASLIATPATGDMTKVSFGYIPVMSFAPVYVAEGLGYFAEQGLDVDLQQFAGGSEMIAQLATNDLNVGFGGAGPGLFNAFQQGLPLRIIAPGHHEGNPVATPLVVAKSKCESGEIRSVADLKGKKVAINAPGATEYWLSQALAQGGLTMDDVDLQTLPFSDAVVALQSGAIDAALLGEPTATLAEQQGIGVRLTTDFDVQSITPTMVYANTDFLSQNPDAAVGLMAAYMKACQAIMERGFSDPEILPIIAEYTGLPAELISASVSPQFSVDGSISVDSLTTLQTFFRSLGELSYDTDIDPATMIDDGPVTAAMAMLDGGN